MFKSVFLQITCLKDNNQLFIISICTPFGFLTKTILWCFVNSPYRKQVQALKSNKAIVARFLGPRDSSVIKQKEGLWIVWRVG